MRRSYFRCTAIDCHAKKRVDKLLDAPPDAKPLTVVQIGHHNHQPRPKPRPAPFSLTAGASAAEEAEDDCGLLPGLVLPEGDPSTQPEVPLPPTNGDSPLTSGCEVPACGPSSCGPKQRLFLDWDRLRAEDIAAVMYQDLRRQLVLKDEPQGKAPARAPSPVPAHVRAPSGVASGASSLPPSDQMPNLHTPAECSNRLRSEKRPLAPGRHGAAASRGDLEHAPVSSISTTLSDLGRPRGALGAAAESMGSSEVRGRPLLQQQQVDLETASRELRATLKRGARGDEAAALPCMLENELGVAISKGKGLKGEKSELSSQEVRAGALFPRAEVDLSWSGMSTNAEVPGASNAWGSAGDLRTVPEQALCPASAGLHAPDRPRASMARGSSLQATRGGCAGQGEAGTAPLDCPPLGDFVFQDFVAASGVGAHDGSARDAQWSGEPRAACPQEDQSCTVADLELEFMLRSCDYLPLNASAGRPLGREWGAYGDLQSSETMAQGVHLVDLPALAFETGCHDLLMRLT